jgi:histidine kinase
VLHRRYRILETLHENNTTVVYRASRLSDSSRVIIKMIKPEAITQQTIAQFMNEQQILSTLKSPKIIKLIEAVSLPLEYYHVFEDIGGESLYDRLSTQPFELSEALHIGIKIAETLAYIHQKHIIHADINPKNIIYNPQSQALQIIDFGYSLCDNHLRFNHDVNVGNSGNLMYMSPEQTGKTKRRIDYRSDWYSFGMSLYHLFSGKPPFVAKDRHELIHKQIALRPTPIEAIVESFPSVLSEIIAKLTSKQSDERYQSDEALIHDLKQALKTLDPSGSIPYFEIALHDQRPLRVGDHLYGREGEIATLKEAARNVASHTPIRLAVSGVSGVGKTRLIEEFITFLNTGGALVLRGKFEPYRSAHPYFSFKQLFAQLKTAWPHHLAHDEKLSLNPQSAYALRYYFPELDEKITAPKTKITTPKDALPTQLPFALHEVFKQLATDASPLVIFMDDVQWADPASLDLIQKTICQSGAPNLHFVFSFRSDEILANINASEFVRKICDSGDEGLYLIELNPLDRADVEKMFHSLFGNAGERVERLAELIYQKTAGNPFYIKTLLSELIERKEITFARGRWEFDLDTIRTYGARVDIASLMTSKFSQLSLHEQRCLQFMAILGSHFDIDLTLEMMKSLKYPADVMEELEKKGFIELYNRQYRFVHDMILHHLLSTISPLQKETLHRFIGKFLERAYRAGRYDDVIGTVYHLNRGSWGGDGSRQSRILNLKALGEMVLSGSYTMALEHLRWIEAHAVIVSGGLSVAEQFDFDALRVKIYYLNALHDEALSVLNAMMEHSEKLSRRLVCFSLLKNLCVTRGSGFETLVCYGNALLSQMGITIPANPEEVSAEVGRLERFITSHRHAAHADAVTSLPRLKSLSKEQVVALLVEYWEGAYYLADIDLMKWAYLNIIDVSFRYGNSSGSAFGYVLYGAQMVSEYRFEEGYRFADAALKLNRLYNDAAMLPKVHNFVANFISPYVKPLSHNLPLYQKSLHQSKINGDIVFGTWANFLIHLSSYLSGTHLETLRAAMDQESALLIHSGDHKMIAIFDVLYDTIRKLQEGGEGSQEKENQALALWEEEHFAPALAWYAILKAQTCWIEGDHERGLEYLKRYLRSEANEVIMFPKLRLHPLRALLLLGKTSPLSSEEETLLAHDLAMCDRYASASPKEFKFWKLLIRAKREKNLKHYGDIAKLYDEALKEGRSKKNPFYIAAAAVCAARFWKGREFGDLSSFYFSEASVALNQWGAYDASMKLRASERTASGIKASDTLERSSSNSSLLRSEPTNYRSLLKSFYALSESMEKKELLQTLMGVILENATASKAVLILKERGRFYTSAQICFKDNRVDLYRILLEQSDALPVRLITSVIDTHHKVIQNDPARSGAFQHDPYFAAHKPASSIAIPALLQGEVKGVLYLENDEISVPLDADTLQTLRLLLTQTLIIHKNALLYETLQQREEGLKNAQKLAKIGSWTLDLRTNELEWSDEIYRIFEIDPNEFQASYEGFLETIHPDERDFVAKTYESSLMRRESYAIEHRLLMSDGRIKWVREIAEHTYGDDGTPITSRGTVQEITESKRSKEEIEKLSKVVKQTPLSTIITDAEGVIEYVNDYALQMSGYSEAELVGQKMGIFNSGVHSKAFYADLWSKIKTQHSFWRGTIINRMRDGRLRDCASTIFPIMGPQNTILNFVTIQDDVTERNMKDRAFLMQTRQAQMGEMLSMIAHQWRQPLAIMSALISRQKINIMLERYTLEDIVHSFDEMEKQVQHLSRTITDFKDFFKPDKETAMTKSSQIVSKTLELIEHTLMNKNINVEVSHQHDEAYRTYENELIQVMLNLLKNAQDACEEKKILKPLIRIRTDQEEGFVLLRVEDNAGGIDPQILSALFSPYATTKKENGTGLGLYMSKTIIEEHCHGTIRVENTAEGAAFTLRFPIQHE